MATTRPETKKRKMHPMVIESRQRLLALKGTGDWARIARQAGLSYRSISAIAQGSMREMAFTREARLAQTLGISLVWLRKEGEA